jgi:hypothetical protein
MSGFITRLRMARQCRCYRTVSRFLPFGTTKPPMAMRTRDRHGCMAAANKRRGDHASEYGFNLRKFGHEVEVITPEGLTTVPCPTYPESVWRFSLGRRSTAESISSTPMRCISQRKVPSVARHEPIPFRRDGHSRVRITPNFRNTSVPGFRFRPRWCTPTFAVSIRVQRGCWSARRKCAVTCVCVVFGGWCPGREGLIPNALFPRRRLASAVDRHCCASAGLAIEKVRPGLPSCGR